MNSADDRMGRGGSPRHCSVLLRSLTAALLVGAVLVSISGGCCATVHRGHTLTSDNTDAAKAYASSAVAPNAEGSSSRRARRSDEDSASEMRSTAVSSDADTDSDSSSSDGDGQPAVQGAIQDPQAAVVEIPTDPAEVAIPPDTSRGFAIPDIFAGPAFMAGVGDIPELTDGTMTDSNGNVVARRKGNPPTAPKKPANCAQKVICKQVELMRDFVSFAYESVLNVLYEISSTAIPAILKETKNLASGRRECSDILFMNSTHLVVSIRHGKGDAMVRLKLAPLRAADGSHIPSESLYTTGELPGFGALQNHITYNTRGQPVNSVFLVRFPNAKKFVKFPVTGQECSKCGEPRAPVYPVRLDLIPKSEPERAIREAALTTLIEYTCI
ncbi:uncharacterized protein LOC135811415 [Sycon ciliatum]|uniref:uncharacterized protein LOC135811415 n=1 Tax=Sycon ciliatum TaxID=27933 RepID=UPI0031F626BE